MATLFARGGILYFDFIDANGKRRQKSSQDKKRGIPGFRVGQEAEAEKALAAIVRRVEALRELARSGAAGASQPIVSPKGVTIEMYWNHRLKRRQMDPETASAAKPNVWHGRDYILPLVGHHRLDEFRPLHAQAFVAALKAAKREDGAAALAPRTLHTVWAALRGMFRSAVVESLVPSNPCVLERNVLPKKKDRDPTWRRNAVFSREEVELLISLDSLPPQRRTLYALLLMAGLRPGEASALHWRDYLTDAPWEPLGMLDIQRAYDTDTHTEGDTKTEKQRLIPVHPTLASILAQWKLSGWQEFIGRAPKAEDLVVPTQALGYQGNNGMRNRAMEDVRALGWRQRRLYDSRRTFITRCQSDGIPKDIYRWWTHGPPAGHDAVDLYASIDWAAHCREMLKLKIEVRRGRLVQMAAVGARDCDSSCDTQTQVTEITTENSVGARGFEPRLTLTLLPATEGMRSKARGSGSTSSPINRPTLEAPITLSQAPSPALRDSVSLALRDALRDWNQAPDPAALKRDLESILGALS